MTAKPPFIHESAYVDEGAVIGSGTKVWHFCHVMPGAVVGNDCSLGQNVVVMGGTRIGNNVKIQNNVSVYEGVELEDDVFCGPSMVFTNVVNPRSAVSRKHEYKKTLVGRGATIGANATVVCGVTLGRYAFIGAGAVVTRDVPAHALMTGVPAKRTGWMCECGVKLEEDILDIRCSACGKSYARKSQTLTRVDEETK
jgi:UDP-2-acetamido-3-amino-2,3-dideoxy-glucuronate N-acetyltransferase